MDSCLLALFNSNVYDMFLRLQYKIIFFIHKKDQYQGELQNQKRICNDFR